MVGLEILVRVPPENRQEFIHSLKLLSRPERRPADCLGHTLFEDISQPNRFIWIEHWTEAKALEAHMRTERFHSLLGAMDVLGTLDEMRMANYDCNLHRMKDFPVGAPERKL